MVLLNYENFIKQKITQQASIIQDILVINALKLDSFHQFLIKLYQYCQEINIIQQRMKILAEETEKIKGMKPKLLQSQTLKVGEKIKQIGSIYSVFLMQQKRFKVLSDESTFYERIYQIVVNIMQKCFTKSNFQHLEKCTFHHLLTLQKFIVSSEQIHSIVNSAGNNMLIKKNETQKHQKKIKNDQIIAFPASEEVSSVKNRKLNLMLIINRALDRNSHDHQLQRCQFDLRKKQKKMHLQKL